MPSENTLKILNDLKAAGIDTSSIERQISIDRLAERQADSLLGGGILRQADYNRYMNELQTRERQIQGQVQQLATLHDAQNTGIELPQQALSAIEELEKSLIATGEFDEQSVKNISYQARIPLEKMIKDKQQPAPQPQNINLNPVIPPQSQIDPNQFVDVATFRQAMGNLAYGDIATTMEINARIDEVRALGIPVTRKEIAKLQENLRKNFEGGGNLDQAFEDTFEVSKAVEAKQTAEIEKRIKDETDKRVAEELKNAGVPVTKKFDFGRRHVIFDKNKRTPESAQPPQKVEGQEGDPLNKELPKNKYGDVEIFRSRRGRDERMQNAAATHERVMEHYANDPTYVE